jgi:hypothetical protein
MNTNLIDFSKFTADKQTGIDIEAAKQYFISEVLPYVGEASLQRLIRADISGDPHFVKVEMMRMFVESELMRTTQTDTSRLKTFFKSTNTKLDPQ